MNTNMGRKNTQPTPIPPEGDAYNAQRQEELYAAITNRATLARRYAELVRDPDADAEQIRQLTEAMVQVERDIPRLSQELAVSTQGRNLNTFLERLDSSLALKDASDEARHREHMDGLVGVGTRLGKIEADHMELAGLVSDIGETLSETRSDVDVLKVDMQTVKQELATIKATVGMIASEQAEMKASLAYMRQRLDDNPPPDAVARLIKPDANQ